MKKVAFVLSLLFIGSALADSAPTSVGYVDSQISELQNKISAVDTNTLLTHTNTAGEIGQKSIYDSTGNYVEQQNALVTAEVANAAIQNAIDTEFVCTEWLDGAPHTNENCLIYNIRPVVTGKNLFDKNDPDMQFLGYINGYTGRLTSNPTQGDRTLFVRVKPNTTYTIQRNTNISTDYNAFRIAAYTTSNVPANDAPGTILFNQSDTTTPTATITTQSDTTYLGIYVRNIVPQPIQSVWQEFLDSFQVEEGSIATSYEPHRIIYLPSGQ